SEPASRPGSSLCAAARPAPAKDRAAAEPITAMVFFKLITFLLTHEVCPDGMAVTVTAGMGDGCDDDHGDAGTGRGNRPCAGPTAPRAFILHLVKSLPGRATAGMLDP